jgi:hypothetical protein
MELAVTFLSLRTGPFLTRSLGGQGVGEGVARLRAD